MHFRSASAGFMATHFFRLSSEDRSFVFESANTLDACTSTFIVVPMHCDEDCLRGYLNLVAYQAKCSSTAIIIFFNGDAHKTTLDNFNARRFNAECDVEDARKRFGYRSIYLLSRLFTDTITMGRLRGLLCDIVCVLARAKRINHPIIINMDVDTRIIAEQYVSSFAKAFSSNVNIKMSAGEVNYGYRGLEPVAVPDNEHVPELFIFNQLIKAIQRCARNGDINFEKRIWFEGCSMAFSLAAYCACGGFDFERKSGEDDALGRAMHRYNPNAFSSEVISEDTVFECDPFLTAFFNPQGWMVTDPRRILQAISLGLPGIEAWADAPFMDNAGAHMNLSELAQRCRTDAAYIGISELEAARDYKNIDGRNRLAHRLYSLIYRSIMYDRKARNDLQIRRLLDEVGICIKPGENVHSKSPKMDWGKSTLFNALVGLGHHATYS